jgi:hypothetical protein
MPAQEIFERSPRNPILSPQDLANRAVVGLTIIALTAP